MSRVIAAPQPETEPAELGRPELRRFIIASRHPDAYHLGKPAWTPPISAAVLSAYDRGLVEMCQGRDERTGLVIQYAIPRKSPEPRVAPYFGKRLKDPALDADD